MVTAGLGWVATVLFSAMLIPQIVKTLRTRTLQGVSVWMHIMYLAGNVVALAYAVQIGQAPLVAKYAFALLSACVFLWIARIVKEPE